MTRAVLFVVSFWFIPMALGLDNAGKKEITQAYEHFNKKEYAKVTPLLWKNIDTLRAQDFNLLMKSHALLQQGDDLLRVTNLLVSKNENDVEAHHYRGRAYLLKKKDKEALESFQKAISLNKKHLSSYLELAKFYESKKNIYEQRVVYQDMLTNFGPRAEILTNLCKLHAEDGLNEQAEKYCKQAIQIAPVTPDSYVYLGVLKIQSGDRPQGKKALKAAAEKFPKSELALFNYGKVLEEDKNFIDSYKNFKQCHQIDEKSERCLLGYAIGAFEIQKFQEAHDSYKKLCRINRNNSVHVRRGLANLRSSGQKDWAQKFQELSDFCSM